MNKDSKKNLIAIACIMAAVFVVVIGYEKYTDNKIRLIVGKDANDPDSMLIRNKKKLSGGNIYCVEVNGKNHFGAYVGYNVMWVDLDDNSAITLNHSDSCDKEI